MDGIPNFMAPESPDTPYNFFKFPPTDLAQSPQPQKSYHTQHFDSLAILGTVWKIMKVIRSLTAQPCPMLLKPYFLELYLLPEDSSYWVLPLSHWPKVDSDCFLPAGKPVGLAKLLQSFSEIGVNKYLPFLKTEV